MHNITLVNIKVKSRETVDGTTRNLHESHSITYLSQHMLNCARSYSNIRSANVYVLLVGL